MTGTAETKIKRSDYNLVIPNIPFVASVDDEFAHHREYCCESPIVSYILLLRPHRPRRLMARTAPFTEQIGVRSPQGYYIGFWIVKTPKGWRFCFSGCLIAIICYTIGIPMKEHYVPSLSGAFSFSKLRRKSIHIKNLFLR